MGAPLRSLVQLVAVVLVLVGPGCLEATTGDGATQVALTTAHDPALSREEDRDRVPDEGGPASHGRVNVFLFTPADFQQMNGRWGLWDPVAPPERGPGDLVVFPDDHGATFPLDQDGRTSFRVQAPEGTVLGFWIRGSTGAHGADGCQDRFFYTSPDTPPVTHTVGSDDEVGVEVPFGMGCTEG